MKLSAVIPAHNEEGSIAETVGGIVTAMERGVSTTRCSG
jgi:hypothetical protein